MVFSKKLQMMTSCILLVGLLGVQGCAVKVNNPSAAENYASTATKPVSEDVALNSDGDIIRDMVTKTAFNQEPLNWLNPSTGNIGVISAVEDENNSNCRNFKTSREAFDGVALYQGKVCETAPGVWKVQKFSQVN